MGKAKPSAKRVVAKVVVGTKAAKAAPKKSVEAKKAVTSNNKKAPAGKKAVTTSNNKKAPAGKKAVTTSNNKKAPAEGQGTAWPMALAAAVWVAVARAAAVVTKPAAKEKVVVTTTTPQWLSSVSIKPLKATKSMSCVDALNATGGNWGSYTALARKSFFDSHGITTDTQIDLLFCIAGLAQDWIMEEPPNMSTADATKWKEVSEAFRGEEREEGSDDSEDDDESYDESEGYGRSDVISYSEIGPFIPFMKYYTEEEAEELIENSLAKY